MNDRARVKREFNALPVELPSLGMNRQAGRCPVFRLVLAVCVFVLAPAAVDAAAAQAWDVSLWASGASTVAGSGTRLIEGGVAAGRIFRWKDGTHWMTFHVQVIPAVFIMQPDTVHAVAVTPALAQFPFARKTWPVTPYFDIGFSLLFSNRDIPPDTSSFNFMTQAGLGALVPVSRGRSLSLEMNFLHISNADIVPRNPGVNMMQLTIGYHIGF